MNQTTTCPQCGAELPAAAADRPCPACLMKLGLASWAEAGRSDANLAETTSPDGTFDAPSVEELAPLFPHLEIESLLGKGGMGAVYRARQKSLDRPIAVKIISPRAAANPGFAERFSREAKALARLNHPHIVTVYDFGEAQGYYFLSMEFVDGANVRQLLRQGLLTPGEALEIVPQMCDALQFAHEAGIVHRDIKPENILIDRQGRVKIADFGLAKLVARSPRDVTLTADNQTMGTMHYMAPEQMERPLEVDHRADIYSLGVTLYEMLTGELPLGRFASPSQKVEIDVRLDEVVLRALEREPAKRYQQASEVKTDLRTIASSGGALKGKAAADAGSVGHGSVGHGSVGNASDSGELVYAPGIGSRLLSIAIMLLVCLLMCLGALAMIWIGIYLLPDNDGRWGFIAGGGGMLLGALGGLFGTWNNYRQFQGKSDLMKEAHWNGVDTIAALLLLAGSISLAAIAWQWPLLNLGQRITFATLTGIVTLNALAVSLWRMAQRQAARRIEGQPVTLDLRLVLVACGMLAGGLLMLAGLAVGIIAILYQPGGEAMLGGWLGTSLGCFFGGGGSLFGSWNSYRRMEGAADIWATGKVTAFDGSIVAGLLLGLGLLAAGLLGPDSWHRDLRWGMGLIGGIFMFQALIFGIVRGLTLRAARQERRAGIERE